MIRGDVRTMSTSLWWRAGFCCLSLSGLLSGLLGAAAEPHADAHPTFDDVEIVLAKGGCNSGACHGNFRGRGGLRLSLRGEDPTADYRALTRGELGRRLDRLSPDDSLLLRKSSGQLAHEGGVRFGVDSELHQLLREWIRIGAPPPDPQAAQVERLEVDPPDSVLVSPQDSLQLRAIAVLADGTKRDVSRLAVYEPSTLGVTVAPDGQVRRVEDGESTVVVRYLGRQVAVRVAFIPDRPAIEAPASVGSGENEIDRWIDSKLSRLRIVPSLPCDDATFIRRLYLDLLAIPPTSAEARAFVADMAPDKRTRLVEEVLARPELADHWALLWSDLLRNEEKVLDARGVDVFHAWLRDRFADGTPLDKLARSIVESRGSTYQNPPANYYRACRTPAARGETTAQVFLGVRLQCAQCHNHPFDRWTQDDYYDWGAVFARVDYEIVENNRQDKLDQHEFAGEQIVVLKPEGTLPNPRTQRDASPRLLGAEMPPLAADADPLVRLGEWLTGPDNRQFSRVMANRIWAQVMGRGLVEPVDDFRVTNPPSHPELLEMLTDELIASGHDLRHLLRNICTSRAYGRSSLPTASGAGDLLNYSHARVERLPAETLLDAQSAALDAPLRFAGHSEGLRAGQLPGVRRSGRRGRDATVDDQFLLAFGKPLRLLACECERSNETTLKQALVLVAGASLERQLTAPQGRVGRLARRLDDASQAAPARDIAGERRAVVDELYWSVVGRAPTPTELDSALRLLAELDARPALEDLAWGLINSKEFLFRH